MAIGAYEKVEDGEKIVISPSSLMTFINNSGGWHKRHITKENKSTPNYNTVFGNVIHHILEVYNEFFSDDETEELKKEIKTYLSNMEIADFITKEEYDWITEHLDEYINISQEITGSIFVDVKSEIEKEFKLLSNIPKTNISYGGTVDVLFESNDNTIHIIDYKTVSSNKKSEENKIPDEYYLQLMIYALLAKVKYKKNVVVKAVTIKKVKKLKTKKDTVSYDIHTKIVEESDYSYIKKQLKLLADCIIACENNKDFTRLIFRDNDFTFYGN